MRLDVSNVTKKIKGKIILDNINLELVSGRIYGFVGENGSGKTMLFRAISGLMRLTSGQVSVDGQVLHKDISVLPGLGIIIENAGLYPELTGFDNLRQLAKINKKIDDEQIKESIIRDNSTIGDTADNLIGGMPIINMGFVNEMTVGKEYLVFLGKELNTYSKDRIYLTADYTIVPIFACDNVENIMDPTLTDGVIYTSYDRVSGAEFFVLSDNLQEKVWNYK